VPLGKSRIHPPPGLGRKALENKNYITGLLLPLCFPLFVVTL
jgi:hypothetical protein